MIVQDSFRAETLKTMHTEVLFSLIFRSVEHKPVEVFDEYIMFIIIFGYQ